MGLFATGGGTAPTGGGGGLFGGAAAGGGSKSGLFGGEKDKAAPPAVGGASTGGAGGLFGGGGGGGDKPADPKGQPAPALFATGATTTATPSASGGGGLFGGGDKDKAGAAGKDEAVSTMTVPTAIAPELKGKNLEEIVNLWSSELEDHVQLFMRQANQVAAYDQRLLENSDKLVVLHQQVQRVQVAQQELDQNLEFIQTQQAELHSMLETLEKEMEATLAREGELAPADMEREKAYQMAEEINSDLDQMGLSLRQMVERLNATQQRSSDPDKPLSQIARILNAHLNSLQWIDQKTAKLQGAVQALGRSDIRSQQRVYN